MKKSVSLMALAVLGLSTFTYAATPLLNLDNVFGGDFNFGYTENHNISVDGFVAGNTDAETGGTSFVLKTPLLLDNFDHDVREFYVLLGKHSMSQYATGENMQTLRSELSEMMFAPTEEDVALGEMKIALKPDEAVLETGMNYYGIVVPLSNDIQEGTPSKQFCFNFENKTYAEGDQCKEFGVVEQEEPQVADTLEDTDEQEHNAAGADMGLADISDTVVGNKIILTWTPQAQSSNVEITLFDKNKADFVTLATVPMSQGKFEYQADNSIQEYIFTLIPRDANGRERRYPVDVRHESDVQPEIKKTPQVGPVEDMMLIALITGLCYLGYRVVMSKKYAK